MREKNHLKSFTGKRPRRDGSSSCLLRATDSAAFVPGGFDNLITARRDTRLQRHRDSLKRQQNLLHHEINRGREYLQQVQRQLDESRASLEQWNRYELISSAHPLDHLIEAMALQEKTEQFLVGWLNRKQEKLAKLREDIACASRQSANSA